MYTGKVRASSIYREYPAPDTSVQVSEDLPKKISALDQVVGLVCSIESHLETVQASTQTDQATLALLKQPKRAGGLRLSLVSLRTYAAQLDMVLKQKSKLGDLKQELALPVLAQIANDSISLSQILDNAAMYPPTSDTRRNKVLSNIRIRVVNIVKSVSILKSMFGEYRASLMLEQRNKERQQSGKPTKTSALFDDGQNVQAVLEGFKNKGWHVDLRKNDKDVEEDDTDGYSLSVALIERVKKPATTLLKEDTQVGVVRFPVIVRVRSKLSEQMIGKCTDPKVGYGIYFVFGGYITIDNAMIIGINRALMSVYDNRGKVKVDTDKFTALLPYAAKTSPEWEEPLKHIHPVHPAKLSGSHYYMLLMPDSTMGESRHSISDWSFLSY